MAVITCPCSAIRCGVGVRKSTSALHFPRGSRLQIRSLDFPDNQPNSDEWRPPSDWDKAWKTYKRLAGSGKNHKVPLAPGGSSMGGSNAGPRRSGMLSSMEQYVSRSPNHANYPLSEDADAVRRTERAALGAWTDQRFTYAGFCTVVLMILYIAVIVGPPPL